MSQIHVKPDRGVTTSTPPDTPRWVKAVGIITVVVVLLVGIIMLTGVGGQHGPARHIPPTQQSVPQP